MSATATTSASDAQQLARASADYLAISRGRASFASDASWDQAEQTAWEHLMAVTRLATDEDPGVAARI